MLIFWSKSKILLIFHFVLPPLIRRLPRPPASQASPSTTPYRATPDYIAMSKPRAAKCTVLARSSPCCMGRWFRYEPFKSRQEMEYERAARTPNLLLSRRLHCRRILSLESLHNRFLIWRDIWRSKHQGYWDVLICGGAKKWSSRKEVVTVKPKIGWGYGNETNFRNSAA